MPKATAPTNTNPVQSPKRAFATAFATFQAFCAVVFTTVAALFAPVATVFAVVATVSEVVAAVSAAAVGGSPQ